MRLSRLASLTACADLAKWSIPCPGYNERVGTAQSLPQERGSSFNHTAPVALNICLPNGWIFCPIDEYSARRTSLASPPFLSPDVSIAASQKEKHLKTNSAAWPIASLAQAHAFFSATVGEMMQTCHRTRSGTRHSNSTVRDVSKTGKAEGETGRTESDITRELKPELCVCGISAPPDLWGSGKGGRELRAAGGASTGNRGEMRDDREESPRGAISVVAGGEATVGCGRQKIGEDKKGAPIKTGEKHAETGGAWARARRPSPSPATAASPALPRRSEGRSGTRRGSDTIGGLGCCGRHRRRAGPTLWPGGYRGPYAHAHPLRARRQSYGGIAGAPTALRGPERYARRRGSEDRAAAVAIGDGPGRHYGPAAIPPLCTCSGRGARTNLRLCRLPSRL